MSYLWTYFGGVITGIYIEQNYTTFNIKNIIDTGLKKIKRYGKIISLFLIASSPSYIHA